MRYNNSPFVQLNPAGLLEDVLASPFYGRHRPLPCVICSVLAVLSTLPWIRVRPITWTHYEDVSHFLGTHYQWDAVDSFCVSSLWIVFVQRLVHNKFYAICVTLFQFFSFIEPLWFFQVGSETAKFPHTIWLKTHTICMHNAHTICALSCTGIVVDRVQLKSSETLWFQILRFVGFPSFRLCLALNVWQLLPLLSLVIPGGKEKKFQYSAPVAQLVTFGLFPWGLPITAVHLLLPFIRFYFLSQRSSGFTAGAPLYLMISMICPTERLEFMSSNQQTQGLCSVVAYHL